VLHLHGSIPDPNVPELELDNSGYRHLPGKYKVIVAAPSGTLHPDTGFYFWNATEACCGFEPTFGEQVDDAGFLNRLLDELLAIYPIDPRRVYIYGYSNGAFMAYRMACDHAERFAAIAVGAGVTFNDPERCAPSSPVSVLHFHSMEDEVVLFNGGNLGFIVGEPDNPVYNYPGAIETVEQWADLNGCKGNLKFGKKPRFDFDVDVEGKETTVNQFTRCPKGIDVELWSMEGVDHPPLSFGFGPDGIKTLAKETWKFLRKHKINDDWE
jgi:polyhydroxybutyrate depolymerase